MRRLRLLLATLPALILGGCPHDNYEIEMWPQGQKIERAVKVTHVEDDNNPPKLVQESIHLYDGQFRDPEANLAGEYSRYPADLGTAFGYIERVRGDDDQAGLVEAQFKAADRLTDLLVGWSRQEFSKFEGYDKLRTFLDRDFRRDLKNLTLLLWLNDATERTVATQPDDPVGAAQKVILVRGAQYFIERGYFKPDQLPLLMRVMDSGSDHDLGAALAGLAPGVLQKIGLADQYLREKFTSMIKGPDKAMESLKIYIEQTPEFKKAHANWEANKAAHPTATQPEEPSVWQWTVEPLLPGSGFHVGSADEFQIALHTGRPAVQTNGNWDAAKRTTTWAFRFAKGIRTVPAICYATWANPDESAQRTRFGRMVLDGEDLVAYCLWHSSLTKSEAEEWAGLLGRIKPGTDLASLLGEFHFSTTPATTQPEGHPVKGAELILKAMGLKLPQTQPESGNLDK